MIFSVMQLFCTVKQVWKPQQALGKPSYKRISSRHENERSENGTQGVRIQSQSSSIEE